MILLRKGRLFIWKWYTKLLELCTIQIMIIRDCITKTSRSISIIIYLVLLAGMNLESDGNGIKNCRKCLTTLHYYKDKKVYFEITVSYFNVFLFT